MTHELSVMVEVKGKEDWTITAVEMGDITFIPLLRSPALRLQVKYKEIAMPFDSLPIELQAQLKALAMERVAARLEYEGNKHK